MKWLAVGAVAAAVVSSVMIDGPAFDGPCPRGLVPREVAVRMAQDAGVERPVERGACVPFEGESAAHKALAADVLRFRRLSGRARPPRGAYRRAARAAATLGRVNADIRGSAGGWSQLGRWPLTTGLPDYPATAKFESGWAGRVSGFAHDPARDRVYASVSNGGLWASDDRGATWRSVGDALPTQEIGAVAFSSAEGGTLLALTGDSFVFGGYGGLGVYRSTDDGRTWQRSTGPPDSVSGYAIRVDPARPGVVYAATGAGLFRSTDAGRSFVDVALPTSERCAGDSGRTAECSLANHVTDVVVQPPDRFGHAGGAVLAVVGWVYGRSTLGTGPVDAAQNGMYRSSDGTPGSFAFVDPLTGGYALGEPPQPPSQRAGRTELAVASGPGQNSNYVYANIADAARFRARGIRGTGVPELYDPVLGLGVTAGNTTWNGLYVSEDFGASWTRMAGPDDLIAPSAGSGLAAGAPYGFGPGIQSWFNQAVDVDPTRATETGVPTRVTFGLEEVWQNVDTDEPQDGPSRFHAIGRYYEGEMCFGAAMLPFCPDASDAPKSSTTHPDQHAQLSLSDAKGGVTLFAGGDGGIFTQHVGRNTEMSNAGWGKGANVGLRTLLPYTAAMSGDGVTYLGMQDNGFGRIGADGTMANINGGDGFSTAVHPTDSDLAYGEFQYGGLYRTDDGGRTYDYPYPNVREPDFWSPFVMDPTDPEHLVIASRNVRETKEASAVTFAGGDGPQWKTVFDLGTRKHPGDASAAGASDDPSNIASTVAVRGAATYVGFCAPCSSVFGRSQERGLATNASGEWRIAAARGLPNRVINAIAIDPQDARTVFVGIGGFLFPNLRPKAGDGALDRSPGHVFRSTDGGETFADVSGDLPDLPVLSLLERGGQLVAGTDHGVFLSDATAGRPRWVPLQDGLAPLPVVSLQLKPGDPDLLVATTHGRGVFTYRFADPAPVAVPAPACAAGAARRAASVKETGAGLRVAPRPGEPVTVEVHSFASARRVRRARRLIRLPALAQARTLRLPRGVGVASVRVTSRGDEALTTLVRRGRRWIRLAGHRSPTACSEPGRLELSGPAFGGASRTGLDVLVRAAVSGRVTLTARGPGGVRRRLASRQIAAGSAARFPIRARKLARRGAWRIEARIGTRRLQVGAWRL